MITAALFVVCVILAATCAGLVHRVHVLTEENDRKRVVNNCAVREVSRLSETQPYA